MCSGIFLFGPQPVLALSFDYCLPLRLTYEREDAFCMRILHGPRDFRPLGVSRTGTSANIHLAPFRMQAAFRGDQPDRIEPADLVTEMVDRHLTADRIPGFLDTHTLLCSRDNTGAHCLCADRYGHLCITGPGYPCICEDAFPDGFAVLTNFALSEHLPISRDTSAIRCSRYRTMYRMLLEDRSGADRLFDVLESVKQTSGRMPTLFSMVTVLGSDEIRFTLDGDFTRRFLFSFSDHTVRTETGFSEYRRCELTSGGLHAADLRAWR